MPIKMYVKYAFNDERALKELYNALKCKYIQHIIDKYPPKDKETGHTVEEMNDLIIKIAVEYTRLIKQCRDKETKDYMQENANKLCWYSSVLRGKSVRLEKREEINNTWYNNMHP